MSQPVAKYFCYILRSACTGRTYIGATTNPARRLRQHNGELVGGARATRRGRPWRCVAVVSGLPSWSDALKLEWRMKRGPGGGGRRGGATGGRKLDKCDVLCDVLRMNRWTRTATPTEQLEGVIRVTWCSTDARAMAAEKQLKEERPALLQCTVQSPERAAEGTVERADYFGRPNPSSSASDSDE